MCNLSQKHTSLYKPSYSNFALLTQGACSKLRRGVALAKAGTRTPKKEVVIKLYTTVQANLVLLFTELTNILLP